MNISIASSSDDTAEIARIHYNEIDQGFLRQLGKNVLARLYRAIIENPESFVVIAKEQGETVGFIAGSTNVRSLYGDFFKKHAQAVLIGGFFQLLNPHSWGKIADVLRYPKKMKQHDLPEAELIAIAVKKEFQGKGIAKHMFEIFVEEMKRRRVRTFRVTVGEKLTSAIMLYEKLGFHYKAQVSVHPENTSRIYTYTI